MERPDYNHHTVQENINLLFNMIQSCRTEVAIIKYRQEYKNIKDNELVKVAEALAEEIQFLKRK